MPRPTSRPAVPLHPTTWVDGQNRPTGPRRRMTSRSLPSPNGCEAAVHEVRAVIGRLQPGSTCDSHFATSRVVTLYTCGWRRQPHPPFLRPSVGATRRTGGNGTPARLLYSRSGRPHRSPQAGRRPGRPTSDAASLDPVARQTDFYAAEQTVTVTCPRCGSAGAHRWRRKVACETCGLLWIEYPQPQSSREATMQRNVRGHAVDDGT